MNVLVMYESRNGHTRQAAEAIASAARKQQLDVKLKSVAEVSKLDVDLADVLFVGTWVHGLILFGVRPAGAELWGPSLPPLDRKPVGVFCTYRFNPRNSLNKLDDLLTSRGATVMGQHAFHSSQPASGADAFVREVVKAAERAVV
jgi:flavorubredoxin